MAICPDNNGIDRGFNAGCLPTPMTGDRYWDADVLNTLSEQDWRSNLFQWALTRFEWINVPKEIDPRYIELVLITQGWGCFFQPMEGMLAFCQATQQDNLDMYFNPREVILIPGNGSGIDGVAQWRRNCMQRVQVASDGSLSIVEKDAVACFDNMAREPLLYKIELAAKRLGKMDRVIDVNINAQMTPWVGVAKETAKLDLERYMNQVIGCESVVLTDEGFSTDVTADVLNTQTPFIAPDIMTMQERKVNRFLTLLGIDNAFSLKKEREIAGEMDANNEQIYIAREAALRCRQKACEECNALFGTNMQVRFATRLNVAGGVDFSDEVV